MCVRDVYKRQILGYGLLFGTTVLNVFAYRGIELKVTPMIEATGIIWVTLLAASILGAVSYTHLDVYKRQSSGNLKYL